jgi:hypothetical protein
MEEKDSGLDRAITEALDGLDLSDDPSFEEVLGMSMEDITKHAMEAISFLLRENQLNLQDPASMIQIYVLAFVVGSRHGARRALL